MNDAQIVDLFWRRSEQAVPEAASKYGSYCFSIARRMLDSCEDAEECVNDTWLGAWNAIPPHRPQRLSLFLGKITRRCALGMLRRENRLKRGGGTVTLAYEELADCLPDADAEKMEDSLALRDLLQRFLDSLPQMEKELFLARYWFFASVEELHERTGFSAGKIKSMLYGTRKKLVKFLSMEGYEYDKA